MKKIVIALILFGLDGLGMLLWKDFPEVFFPVYRNFSKKWIAFLASLFSFTKIAVWDIVLAVLVIYLLITLVLSVKKKSFKKWITDLILLVSIICFITVQGWMLNHYAPPLSEDLVLNVRQYSVDELYETTDHYLSLARQYAPLVERDKEGHLVRRDFYEMAKIAGSSYRNISDEYPVFEGSDHPVKKLTVVGEYLLYNGIVGIFMPVTGEAGVPANVPTAPLAFHMTHEAGHRLGLAGEEEANFAAFLACINNEDVRFVYSGYYEAFSYCFSSLYRNDREKALELYNKYDDIGMTYLKLDRSDTSAAYQKYESRLQDVSDHINDAYLKTFSEEGGVKSYGYVVDYLIAWHQEKEK